jgi:type VI protein secretion system component VasK
MAAPRQSAGLQIIFSIFLGLMVTAFVGVGVYTFYPTPEPALSKRIQELDRQQQQIQNFKSETALTTEDRARLQAIQDELNKTQDAMQASMEVWGRNTSIILITFATIVMVLSLIRPEELPVISNGLLLGGVFTMIYGVGWIVATGTSLARFIVMAVALVITLALGYVRFVRGHKVKAAPAEMGAEAGVAVAGLEDRVVALERRMDDAASALGHKP